MIANSICLNRVESPELFELLDKVEVLPEYRGRSARQICQMPAVVAAKRVLADDKEK